MGWMAAAAIGGSLLDSWISSDSAHKKNKTDIKLQRENLDWQERMSNTAVQRRADDFERAGFNRLLAATGTGASTPATSAVTVEPVNRSNIGEGIFRALTAKQMAAQTELTTQQARVNKVEADIRELGKDKEAEARINKNVEAVEQEDLKTAKDRIEKDMSASQLAKLNATWPKLVDALNLQIREGKVNVEALERIASFGGVDASKLGPLIQILIKLLKD